jgi:hypothetical protein
MKFMLLIYNDPNSIDALAPAEFDATMRGCLEHADELRGKGRLLDSQMLDAASTAKSVRIRKDRKTILDGPFAETKELLAGFNLIEADSMDEAVRIAESFPWVKTGCVEVRPVVDIGAVRQRVGA